MKLKTQLIVLVALFVCVAAGSAEDKAWFDLKTCAFCKNFDLGNGDYIVDHMNGKYHNMDNGILAIMVVEDAYKEKFAKAGIEMEKVGAEMEKTGKVPPMCGHCTAYGELMMTGAKSQEFNSDAAMAFMMTSDDPEVVKKLHAFADKNNAEMAKWDAEKKAAKTKKAGK